MHRVDCPILLDNPPTGDVVLSFALMTAHYDRVPSDPIFPRRNPIGGRSIFRRSLLPGFLFVLGVVVGGSLFHQVQPRSFLALRPCDHCLRPNELTGLIAAVGLDAVPRALLGVVLETDKTLVIRYPLPKTRIHYVIIPKHDIKDVADIATEDAAYLVDVFTVLHTLVEREKLDKYRVLSNGPGYQAVRYLHFHLLGE